MIRLSTLLLNFGIWAVLVVYQGNVAHAAATLTVCAIGCDYTTIQAAIDVAAPDDTISVAAGTYVENLSLYDKRLTIAGADAKTTILSADHVGRPLFLYANSTLTLTNVTVRDGLVTDNQGGGIHNDGRLTIDASHIISNSASVAGGGIANFGTLLIHRSVISDNYAFLGNGGGIVNGGRLTVTVSAIVGNHAKARGGGVYHSVGIFTLTNSTVSNNKGDVSGGGIANFDWMSSTNSTISANTTHGAGGGIVNGGRLQAANLTLADNHAGDGNSLYNSGTLTVANTIMADSAAGKNCTNWGIVISLGANLESDAFCGFTASGDLVKTDPLLAPLADNGGATQTHALLPSSPAIDAGSSACPPPTTDQRGVPRPAGSACDIGAFESDRTASMSFTWPVWARTARIAGAYFAPDASDAEINARLDELAAQQVSVVLADSPWGEEYAVWVDDDKFAAVQAVIAKVVQKAHARGLKVVLYQTGLELLSEPARNPGLEHPEWAQLALDGAPLLFNDIRNEDEHWLEPGVWDLWVSPCAFQAHALDRVRGMVATGIDGLWVDQVYLQSSIGAHDDLWPSSDPCSATAFKGATGVDLPAAENWDDFTFQRWIIWRHTQIVDFLLAEKAAAREVNPSLVFLNENSSVDAGRATYVANDPAGYLAHPDMSTGHEIETIGDRMDQGETGMKFATLAQWLAFRTMVAFARGADVGKPSWILTYGYEPRDSAQLAGLVLAEGANFYETKGPEMAETVSATYRTQLFNWIATHEAALYTGESMAEVGLLYSPRTRDLVDTVSGEPYDVQDSTHFAAYRQTAHLLYQAHIPFDIVIDTNTDRFGRYRVLIAPEVQAMDDSTIAALSHFTGTLLTTGDTGLYDAWLHDRSPDVIAQLHPIHFAAPDAQLVAAANTYLLTTTAPSSVQIGLQRQGAGASILLVNTAPSPAPAFTLNLRLTGLTQSANAALSTLDGKTITIPFTLTASGLAIQLEAPAGIDHLALLTVTANNRSDAQGGNPAAQTWLPLIAY